MSTITVCMTGGCLLGKKYSFSGVGVKTTFLQFAERFLPSLGFSFLMGSLSTELTRWEDSFVFSNGKCTFKHGRYEEVVENTFGGSTNVTCVIKKTNHPFNLTIKGYNGQTCSLRVDSSWTFQQLGKFLIGKGLATPDCFIQKVTSSECYSSYLFDDCHTLGERYIDEMKNGDFINVCKISDPFQIFGQCSGYKFVLNVRNDDIIDSLKSQMPSELNLNLSYQIIFDHHIFEEYKRLEDCHICKGSTVHFCPRPIGGGSYSLLPPLPPPLKFVDVSSDKIEKLVVSSTAPDWRIFKEGLTMEGECKNAKCVAFNKKVLSPQGFRTYNLGKDKCDCPMCHVDFEPIRPMYYKCVVVFNGMKSNGTRVLAPPQTFDALQSYKVEKAGICEYKFLILTVTRPSELIKDTQTNTMTVEYNFCHICHNSLSREQIAFPGYCGHQFHKDCVNNWKKVNKSCPLCSLEFAGC